MYKENAAAKTATKKNFNITSNADKKKDEEENKEKKIKNRLSKKGSLIRAIAIITIIRVIREMLLNI